MSAPVRPRGWCPSLRRPMMTGDGLLVRLHPAGGVLTAKEARLIARLAGSRGNGLLEVTSRGNLQIRGVREAAYPGLVAELDAAGFAEPDGRQPPRLTVISPLAGVDPAERFDAFRLAAAIEALAPADLPPKLCVAVDGGGAFPLGGVGADVLLTPEREGVSVSLSSEGDGQASRLGPFAPSDAPAQVARLLEAFARLRREGGTEARRLRELESRLVGELLRVMEERAPSPLPPAGEAFAGGLAGEGSAEGARVRGTPGPMPGALALTPTLSRKRERETSRRERLAAHPLSRPLLTQGPPSPSRGEGRASFSTPRAGLLSLAPGRSALLLALPFGRCTAAQLALAAGWAERAGGTLRLSFTRGLLLPDLTPPDAETLAPEAQAAGLVTDPADPRLALHACPGSPACGAGLAAAAEDAARLAPLFARAGLTVHVSGCPKGCAHPKPADLTLAGAGPGRYAPVLKAAARDAVAAPLDLDEIMTRLSGADLAALVPEAAA